MSDPTNLEEFFSDSPQTNNTLKRKENQDIFYNYIYLDPRKPGRYSYNGLNMSFLYEPFYVGKGKNYSINDQRKYHHLNKNDRSYKTNKIKAISKNFDMKEYIIEFNKNYETNVLENEVKFITSIGRIDLNLGPLTNRTNGGEGASGAIVTDETRKKLSDKAKIREANSNKQEKSEKMKKMRKENPINCKCYICKFLINFNDIEYCFEGTKKDLVKSNPLFKRENINKALYSDDFIYYKCITPYRTTIKLKILIIERPYGEVSIKREEYYNRLRNKN